MDDLVFVQRLLVDIRDYLRRENKSPSSLFEALCVAYQNGIINYEELRRAELVLNKEYRLTFISLATALGHIEQNIKTWRENVDLYAFHDLS